MPETVSGEGYRDFSEPRFFEAETVSQIAKIRSPVDKAHAMVSPVTGGAFDVWKFYRGDTTTADDFNVITPTNSGVSGRWRRVSSDPVSVMLFGAKGDGTTDDTDALVAAFDAGVPLIFPPGKTFMAAANELSMSTDGVTIFGYGATIKSNDYVIGLPLLSIDASRVSILGLTVDGNDLANHGIKILAGSEHVTIRDCEVKNVTQVGDDTSIPIGIEIKGSTSHITIENCLIDSVAAINGDQARGIRLAKFGDGETDPSHIRIHGNLIRNITPAGDSDAIVVQNSSVDCDVIISQNRFEECAKRAIKVQIPGTLVVNNQIHGDCSYSGISIYALRCTARGNLITDVDGICIEVGTTVDTIEDVIVSDNICSISEDGAASFNAIDLKCTTGKRCVVANNVVYRAVNGIRMTGGFVASPIVGNTIDTTTQAGIVLLANGTDVPDRITIDGNTGINITTNLAVAFAGTRIEFGSNSGSGATAKYNVVSGVTGNYMPAAPTTGIWKKGEQVWNSAPSSGQPAGWVCTIAGEPGTWTAMANLA